MHNPLIVFSFQVFAIGSTLQTIMMMINHDPDGNYNDDEDDFVVFDGFFGT